MKQAKIIKKESGYIIYPISIRIQGAGVASEPFIHLGIDEPNEEIVKNIFTALASVKFNLPAADRSQYKAVKKEYLKNVGFKSSREMHSYPVKSCLVTEIDKQLYFTPTLNNFKDKCFNHLPMKKVFFSTKDTPEKIIAAINEAFERCE